jgi:hypothetical protein
MPAGSQLEIIYRECMGMVDPLVEYLLIQWSKKDCVFCPHCVPKCLNISIVPNCSPFIVDLGENFASSD